MTFNLQPRVTITLRRARRLGATALLAVIAIEVASAVACRDPSIATMARALLFLLIPLSPALVALLTPNPLCAVAASMPIGSWLLYAFYSECVRPYQGGGASMVYLEVWFYGFLSAAAAAIVAIPVLRLLRVRVSAA